MEVILKLVDRAVVAYLSYRQGKSDTINEMNVKLIEDINNVKKLHVANESLSVRGLLDSLYHK